MKAIIVKNNVRWAYINNPDYHVITNKKCYYGDGSILFSGTYLECVDYLGYNSI